ncbi:hypothetical protein [Stackebrandtia nassauensis]|uniref:Uncharacterized protein n=1 Tax=Stackebrandtia nassauensis (strain DSM 44728 / CIP 108903 / NRRL B-16338 / NBRC 102104 / LLR-40K-21) TaxID=446470 RepID=D3PX36_STANL|nr:hypothetical protein [Stackebrandtia nassauensis]ADD45260.1 hypothetical protein Snas_5630 [Stackebrandtia nassauensis DSM 44728]
MPDPIMMAIAGAVAGKTAEVAFKGGRKAYDAVVALVKRRFAKEPLAQTALEAAESDPEANTERLAAALELVAAADPEFDRELRQAGQALIAAAPGATVNINSGTVGHDSYQAQTININRDDK